MPDNLDVPLQAGNYAFGEKAVIRIVGTGNETYLWVGLANTNGSCLGVLHGTKLKQLLEVADARRRRRGPKQGKDLGRTAETVKATRPGGRRRG